MQISVKEEYALRALFDLATRPSGEPVKIAEIAKSQKIPQKFLELILGTLKQAGFVESRRGPEGGYLLSASPETLTVGQVLRFIDGSRQRGRQSEPGCPFQPVWKRVDEAVSNVIDNTTLSQLIRDWRERQSAYVPNWDI